MVTDDKRNDRKMLLSSRVKDGNKRIGQIILWIYFVIMTMIYPYYAPGGYLRIGEAKYLFFRNVTLTVVAIMFVVIVCALIRQPRYIVNYYHGMSVTDWFAYGYFVAVMLSYLCSSYKEEALWGADGWYMGAVMQMAFVLLYFFFSRYFVYDSKWLAVWLAGSAGVFLLGILNRYSIYPFTMAGQTPVFISTLGNINWFCGYWSVTASVGIASYWCSEKRWHRLLAGCYSFVAMLVGVVQGSESAYLVFAAVCAALLLFSIHNVRRLCRWVELCIIWLAACQFGRLLRYVPGLRMNYGSAINGGSPSVMEKLTDTNITLWILCVILAGYATARLWSGRKRKDPAEPGKMQNLLTDGCKRNIGAVTAVILLVAGVFAVFHSGNLLYEGTGADGFVQVNGRVMIFNEDWGNGRGVAWNCSIEAYEGLDTLHKVVGVGPDCFAAHMYKEPALSERLAEEFAEERLTNAHNEGLSILINLGALGFLCYVGFVGSMLVRCCKKAHGQILLYTCVAGILSYTVHNVVSFQQVLNTPYFFILLGIGEGLLRESKERT